MNNIKIPMVSVGNIRRVWRKGYTYAWVTPVAARLSSVVVADVVISCLSRGGGFGDHVRSNEPNKMGNQWVESPKHWGKEK